MIDSHGCGILPPYSLAMPTTEVTSYATSEKSPWKPVFFIYLFFPNFGKKQQLVFEVLSADPNLPFGYLLRKLSVDF